MTYRRQFLKYLAASPLLTSYSAFAQEVEETLDERLTDPRDVINVFEMLWPGNAFLQPTLAIWQQGWTVMKPCRQIGTDLADSRSSHGDSLM